MTYQYRTNAACWSGGMAEPIIILRGSLIDSPSENRTAEYIPFSHPILSFDIWPRPTCRQTATPSTASPRPPFAASRERMRTLLRLSLEHWTGDNRHRLNWSQPSDIMAEFFRGWKRKTGVVALLLACLFTVAWVRSEDMKDVLHFRRTLNPDSHRIVSFRGGMTWDRRTMDSGDTWSTHWRCNRIDPLDSFFTDIPGRITDWQWSGFGFEAGESHDLEVSHWRLAWWTIPHHAVVTALTVLSAWLLLSKPSTEEPSAIVAIAR